MTSIRSRIENVMRGREKPGALAAPLAIAETVYGFGIGFRNYLYDSSFLKTKAVRCKVICVGALSVGGAGKTPFVEALAENLLSKKIGILSRGYGGNTAAAIQVVSDGENISGPPPLSADEPYMMARKLKGVPVVCAPDRLAGAKEMVKRFGTEVIIMDDGFQRRGMKRDLDILLLPASKPFGNGRLTPRGILREHPDGAKRADLIALTSAGDVTNEKFDELRKVVAKHAGADTPVILTRGEIKGFANVDGAPHAPPSGPVYAFCGIAEPARFIQSLAGMGQMVKRRKFFPDHYNYTEDDIKTINREAADCGATFIVTTEKDAVRLIKMEGDFNVPLLCSVYKTVVVKGADILENALLRLFS